MLARRTTSKWRTGMGLAATTAVSLVLWALMVWGVVGIIAAIVSGLETPR